MYDTHCHDLAELFIKDDPRLSKHATTHIPQLAQDIQDVIESYFAGLEDGCPRCGSKNMQRTNVNGDEVDGCGDCGLGL